MLREASRHSESDGRRGLCGTDRLLVIKQSVGGHSDLTITSDDAVKVSGLTNMLVSDKLRKAGGAHGVRGQTTPPARQRHLLVLNTATLC